LVGFKKQVDLELKKHPNLIRFELKNVWRCLSDQDGKSIALKTGRLAFFINILDPLPSSKISFRCRLEYVAAMPDIKMKI
jgi:hypothetical protein